MTESAISWKDRFARRRCQLYRPENVKPLRTVPLHAARRRFLSYRENLDPPVQSQYTARKLFLQDSEVKVPNEAAIVMVDDRQDLTGGPKTMEREWDSQGPPVNYMRYPPIGESIFREIVTIPELENRLSEDRQILGAEKRNMVGEETSDPRRISGRGFRRSRSLPLSDPSENSKGYYYEAQVSFLVSGVDEWFWTSYLFVDTYFGKEEDYNSCYANPDVTTGTDPASGSIQLKHQVWNPREYFLAVLTQRMRQVTGEWTYLINTFEAQMNIYQEDRESCKGFVDGPDLANTESLSNTVDTIRRFRDCLARTLDAWDTFQSGEKRYLETAGSDQLRRQWGTYLASVDKSISALRVMHRLLEQKLDLFDSKLGNLMNASSLNQSVVSSRQGSDIGIFTRLSVLYQPFSLVTAIFSMTMIPDDPKKRQTLYIGYSCLLVLFFFFTYLSFRYPKAQDEDDTPHIWYFFSTGSEYHTT
ncbi:transcription factor sef1 [Diplodia corticola]|uniref:Transcription factor sef1 n=1 Tax=Diplodia corticola TaxID=236234 RepID=A0A1J9R4U4_9PEZI|nr:transcription factor sef1 [Diplodia corticola]OJD36486.1 transcription factor sef1 [Diplodia corticola]